VRLVPTAAAAALVLVTPAAAVAKGPSAGFGFAPATPAAGQPVVLTSTSAPRSGGSNAEIAASLWDFDADGVFDAVGASVTTTFAAAGPHVVELKVIDLAGDSATAAGTIPVGPALPPASPPPVTPALAAPLPAPGLMNPFPVVRLQGRLLRHGIRVTRLTVHAPAGARVRGVCLGHHRGCPRRTVVRRSRSSRLGVRLRGLERRLRPGAVIQVYVTDPAQIGKYTRFRVRAGGAPFRRDMCVAAGGLLPSVCPGA
jgi:PKD domain